MKAEQQPIYKTVCREVAQEENMHDKLKWRLKTKTRDGVASIQVLHKR